MIKECVLQIGTLAFLMPVLHALGFVQPLPPQNSAYSLEQDFDFSHAVEVTATTNQFTKFETGNTLDIFLSESVPSLQQTIRPEVSRLPMVSAEAEFEQPLKYPSANEPALASGKAEGIWLENTSSALPKKRGIKSMVIGLLFVVLLLSLNEMSYYVVRNDIYSQAAYKFLNFFETADDKLNKIFRFNPVTGLQFLSGGAALFLSGLATFTKSLLKRRKAKKGLAVDRMPPLRGFMELLGGLLLMGVWAVSPDVDSDFNILSDVAFSLMIVGAILLPLSLIERSVYRFKNRDSASKPPVELSELPEKH